MVHTPSKRGSPCNCEQWNRRYAQTAIFGTSTGSAQAHSKSPLPDTMTLSAGASHSSAKFTQLAHDGNHFIILCTALRLVEAIVRMWTCFVPR